MSKQVIGYCRVSTEDQGRSGLSIDAQRIAIQQWCAVKGYDLIHVFEEVISGGKPLPERKMLQTAMKMAEKAGATIVVSRLDRLSRDALILLTLKASATEYIALNLGEDVNKFMFSIYAVVAEQEREMIRQRTIDALAVLKAKGVKFGNPNKVDRVAEDGKIVLGVDSCTKKARKQLSANADTFAEGLKPTVERMKQSGMSFRAIAEELNRMKTPTARGGKWEGTTVRNLMVRWAA